MAVEGYGRRSGQAVCVVFEGEVRFMEERKHPREFRGQKLEGSEEAKKRRRGELLM